MLFRVLIGQLTLALLVLMTISLAAGTTEGHWRAIYETGLAVFAFGAVAAIPLTFWVLAPGRALVEAIKQVKHGDVERLAAHRGPAKMRELVECVNEMATILQENTYFLAGVSHQLRTELQLLQIRLERLGRHVTPAGAEPHAAAMADVERLRGTLTEQLELANMIELSTPVEVNVRRVVLDRVQAWSDAATRRSLKITTYLQGDPVILTRNGVLEELLDILLDNAVKYSPRSREIDVAVRPGARRVTIRVRDEGPGMTAEDRERATRRGWRGDHVKEDGRGLGLSIADMLVGANGGRLTLDAGPGEAGMDACCTFPIVRRGGNH